MRQNKRAKIVQRQLFLWPDEFGLLIIPTRIDAPPTDRPTKRPNGRSALLSSRSALLLRVQRGKTSRVQLYFSSSSWRSLSSRIGYSFNVATGHYFKTWLTAKIQEAEFQALTLAEAKSAARVELGLDEETIKRLLIRCTSARADFCLIDGILTLR